MPGKQGRGEVVGNRLQGMPLAATTAIAYDSRSVRDRHESEEGSYAHGLWSHGP